MVSLLPGSHAAVHCGILPHDLRSYNWLNCRGGQSRRVSTLLYHLSITKNTLNIIIGRFFILGSFGRLEIHTLLCSKEFLVVFD